MCRRSFQEALKLLAIKSDEESEQIAENFLNGSTDVEQFIAEYIRMRTVCERNYFYFCS